MIFTNKLGNDRNFFHTKLGRMAAGAAATACILSSTAAFAISDTVVAVEGDTNAFFEYTKITYQPGAGGATVVCIIRPSNRSIGTAALVMKNYALQFSEAHVTCSGGTTELSVIKP